MANTDATSAVTFASNLAHDLPDSNGVNKVYEDNKNLLPGSYPSSIMQPSKSKVADSTKLNNQKSILSIPENDTQLIRVSVTSPLIETCDSVIPGVKETYHTYLVNTTSSLPTYSQTEMSVRRRFKDFVDLAQLLKSSFRGFFVPPRPHRTFIQGKVTKKPSFIEERRLCLEKYLKALVSHPEICRSDELRIFLEARGHLSQCLAWTQLHPANPTFVEGTSKFFRQIFGQERTVPTAAEVAQPASLKRDFVRSMRESFKKLEDRRNPTIYSGKEQELRAETEKMDEFKRSVDFAWKWSSYWMDRAEAVGRASESVGKVFTGYYNYEVDSGFLRITAPSIVGKGCIRASQTYFQSVNDCAIPLSTIHSYSEMMTSVLSALKSRESALSTVKMLQTDLENKRNKLSQLEMQPSKSKQVSNLKSDISALEASLTAAQSCYDRVTSHNDQEMERFRSVKQTEWMEMIKGIAQSQYNFSSQLCDIWCDIADELGADKDLIAKFRAQK